MFMTRRVATALMAAGLVAAPHVRVQSKPSIAQFLAPAMPADLVSARKADRIAWLSYEAGVRNVFSAAAPDFKPMQITKFHGDDGVTLSDLQLSDDGSSVAFVRGSEANREGWVADPSRDPNHDHDDNALAGQPFGDVRQGRANLSGQGVGREANGRPC